jgi:hypothetical protein
LPTKTVLALVGGGARDEVILHTALAAARPFAAHLHCLHMRVGSGEAARYSNTEFARGPALRDALSQLESKAITFSGLAAEHVRDFCARSNIEICDTPPNTPTITASYHEEQENPVERLSSMRAIAISSSWVARSRSKVCRRTSLNACS